MGKRLGLRGNDLICFAVIYGFSMDGESQFKGNLNYLGDCMFASKPTVMLALEHLLVCNLILRQEDVVKGRKRCYYSTNVIFDEGKFIVIDKDKEPLPITGKEPLPKEYNNKEYKKEEKSISNDIPKKEQRHKNFVKPTIEEIEAYIKSMGYKSSAEEFFNYHEAGGWVIGRNRPMIDWRAAVRTWESKERKKRPTAYDVNPEDKIKEIKFKSYMREKYPDIETAHKPLSFDGYMELIHDYGVDYVTDKLDHIVTYFGKYKGCDIYKLIKSWLSEDGRD